ncbi:hypothetical protein tinsulaeT_08170 [Thalassotalea insulae]|uniref:histidine kinase n=1 Tax=Thalassotalea insulae TaxID=2056778 RepID=A0ABQ6GS67_9GAMM|nr:ATP-binding protein [Thalassotalea insulae]GLX77477.1 hypothetical protein tinsulaeT_08170 [Thalassotalea insulae]
MSIQNKLFAVFIIFGALLVVSLVALMQWSIGKGMVDYVNQKEVSSLQPLMQQLVSHYRYRGSWEDYQSAHRTFERQIRQTLEGSDFSAELPPHERRPPPPPPRERQKRSERLKNKGFTSNKTHQFHGREDDKRVKGEPPRPRQRNHPVSYALLDQDKKYIVGHYPPERNYSYTPLVLDEKVIGYFAISKRDRLTKGYEFDFVEQQKDYLWLIAGAVLLMVLVIILPFAKHLIAPIKQLTKGMHLLTQGQYQSELSTNRHDEFAELTRDFNELAKTLLANESARKRWLANISHELRTPVAILKGELEAVLDGVRALSIEQIQSAHQEVSHLQRLIEDLHALTSADIGGMSYKKKMLDILPFIEQQANKLQSYLAAHGFTFQLVNDITQPSVELFVDPTRLSQLLENLANNCVKYAQSGDLVRLTVALEHQQLILIIEDNGVGVDEEHLSHLFEHLYRVEHSRNRQLGGSGLGLSICAHIVKAHQGSIHAEPSKLDGLAIHIALPLPN